nr:nucleotidyltransferase domain-containing protein [Geminicoccus harenae]
MPGSRSDVSDGQARLPEIRALCGKYGVRRLELFGSAARGDFDPARSDIDLLVDYLPDYGGVQPSVAYFQLLFDLEALLGRPVDLTVRRVVRNPRLLTAIQFDLRTIYQAQPVPAPA